MAFTHKYYYLTKQKKLIAHKRLTNATKLLPVCKRERKKSTHNALQQEQPVRTIYRVLEFGHISFIVRDRDL